MVKRLVGVAGFAASAALFTTVHHAQSPAPVDFGRDVQPIFRQQCYSCHGPREQKNGFRLDRRKNAMRGGTIAMIGPGNAEGSRLYQRLISDHYGQQMPPTGALPESQIAVIKRWIDEGAHWPDELAGDVPTAPPDPAATDLIDAIRTRDDTRIASIVSSAADVVGRRGPGGATPLMYAALYGDTTRLRTLLDAGADPNVADDNGATALMWAIPDLEKTKVLLERGADVAARSSDGRTPLMIAAGLPGAEPVVRLLIERGAKVRERGPSLFGDISPLILAAYNGDEATFRLLVEKGADLESDGVGALAFSLRSGCKSCVDMILPKLPPPALSVAMMITSPPNGPALAAPLFLPLGADANARGPHGYSALMMAAASEALPVDALRMLIEKGADVNARSADGMTALSFARLRGNTPVVDLLLKAGAKVDEVRPMPSFTYARAATPRDAVARALPLVQHSDREFMKKSGCVSCHNNTLAAMTVAAARTKGLAVDEQIAGTQVKEIGEYIDGWRDRALQGIGIPGDADTVSYILLGLAAEKHPATVATDAMARFIKGQQRADGHWELLAHRPPIESSRLHVTALSMRALQLYAPKTLRAEYEAAIRKAAAWIAQAQPIDTQDRASKLLGLAWSGARKDAIKAAMRDLVKQQRADGGWSQLATLQSDAYATGQALYALSESGMSPSDRAYRKGVSFLLRTQLADGSWFVKSRAVPLQPHFEAGFPHGKDQFISAAATNWAAIALAQAASPARRSTASAPEQTR